MSTPSVVERNLLALSANHPQLGRLISRTRPSSETSFIISRNGAPVPACGERPIQMHSTVDPQKEGRRYFHSYRGAGYLVFLGLGGGYHIEPFLDSSDVSRIVVIEKDPAFLRAVLEHLDLRRILLDPRVRLLAGVDPEKVKDFLISDYLPAIYGDMKTVPLRTSVEFGGQYYTEAMRAIQELIGMVADDYTVQAQFGKKWYVNTLANLPAVQASTVIVKPVRRAFVTGAGPSLESQIAELREIRDTGFLIASDTSLPALLSYGLKPDLVISIDCQLVSYHHFLRGLPDEVPLLLDLASPPVLTRLTKRGVFFASSHPLSLYLSRHWRPLPFIDTSGGNVFHAAVSLAEYLGAREIYLLGVDFSYPEGKAYCRGTYLYPLFRSQEDLLSPSESLFLSFILKNKTIMKDRVHGILRYTTRPLIGYKERLERYLQEFGARIIPLPGKGVALCLQPRGQSVRSFDGQILAAGAPRSDWREFLRNYLKGLQDLPRPTTPISRYLLNLQEDQRSLCITLFPAAAAFREHDPGDAAKEHLRLRKVRDWSIEVARRFLER
ncbi:MAG: 6-hydroxymethylpterin diphosphokinase MptE-like protein [Spirochaetia bacterium]